MCRCALYLERREGTQQENGHYLLFELAARYVAIVVFERSGESWPRNTGISSRRTRNLSAVLLGRQYAYMYRTWYLITAFRRLNIETIYYPNKI